MLVTYSTILDVIIAPVALHIMSLVLQDHEKKYKIAAQNASGYNFGAYTGEISSKHLKEVGVSWVILGHSERRTLFGETDDIVVGKTKLAIENKLKVIFCFG